MNKDNIDIKELRYLFTSVEGGRKTIKVENDIYTVIFIRDYNFENKNNDDTYMLYDENGMFVTMINDKGQEDEYRKQNSISS